MIIFSCSSLMFKHIFQSYTFTPPPHVCYFWHHILHLLCVCVCVCMCIQLYVCVYIHTIESSLIHSSVDGHCFHTLAIVNNPVKNIGLHDLFELVFLCFSDMYPEVELLDHMVVLFLIFRETSIMVSIVATPIYIPPNSVQVFPFLHILDICHLSSFC